MGRGQSRSDEGGTEEREAQSNDTYDVNVHVVYIMMVNILPC